LIAHHACCIIGVNEQRTTFPIPRREDCVAKRPGRDRERIAAFARIAERERGGKIAGAFDAAQKNAKVAVRVGNAPRTTPKQRCSNSKKSGTNIRIGSITYPKTFNRQRSPINCSQSSSRILIRRLTRCRKRNRRICRLVSGGINLTLMNNELTNEQKTALRAKVNRM